MEWLKSESDRRPLETEQLKDGRYYVRRNITERTREVEKDTIKIFYQYEEAICNVAEMTLYFAELKRESEIVDEYTLSLIEQGVL